MSVSRHISDEPADANIIYVMRYEAPCGSLVLGSYGGRLCMCVWEESTLFSRLVNRLCRVLEAGGFDESLSPVIEHTASRLDDYFAAKPPCFDVPLLLTGTPFQKRVWKELVHIPYGRTISYARLARQTGCGSAVRAVANAVGANPVSIFVPCHRVVGSDNSLTGYSGGLDIKAYMLRLERTAAACSSIFDAGGEDA